MTHTLSENGVTGGDRTLTCAFTAHRADHYTTATKSLLVEAGGVEPPSAAYHAAALPLSYASPSRKCSRLESNQHLLGFSQAPSPDRLREQRRGRGGARPRASSTIRLSKNDLGSGMRNRTSINGVKTRRPAISRSPNGYLWSPNSVGQGGLEPPSLG